MSLDIQQVEGLNRKAQQLNSERQQKIGMQQAAKQAYDRAVYAYEQKYGVKLDDTNLQQEYNSVHTDLEKSFNELNTMVTSIENGEYTAQPTQTVVQNTEPIAAQTVPQTAQPTGAFGVPQPNSFGAETGRVTTQIPNTTTVPNFNANTVENGEPAQHRPVSPELLAQASMGAMNQQAPNITPPPIVTPAPTPTTVPSPEQTADPSEQAFTPQGWGTPTPDINQQFASINNGKPFGQ